MLRFGLTAFAGVVLFASASIAQEVCPHQPAIVALADSIIEKRDELSGFPPRNFGTDAAYLKIRYGELSDDEAEALLARLIDGGARTIKDLAFVWSYGKDGGETTRRLLGDSATADFLAINSKMAMRAMLRAGDSEALIQFLVDLPEEIPFSPYQALLGAVVDFSDSDKSAFAKLALSKGKPLLAAGLVAIQRKPKAWDAFVMGLDADTAEIAREMWRWAPAYVGNPELPRLPGSNPPYDPAARLKIHEVMANTAYEPQMSFLGIILNQTGETDKVHAASMALREAIENGTIDRDGPLGPAWLVAYRALQETWGDLDDIQRDLRSFDLNVGAVGGGAPMNVLDTLVAVEALGPYVTGEIAGAPDMPAELSPDAQTQWPQWLATADRVKADPGDPALAADDVSLRMAAELLLAAGNADAVAALVAGSPTTSSLLRVANDAAVRLDRLCESYLAYPAEALLLNGEAFYRFDN